MEARASQRRTLAFFTGVVDATRAQPQRCVRLENEVSGLESIDELMTSFAVWRGEVPPEGKRIDHWAALTHASPWIRHNIGRGVVQSYVIGFALEKRWWTYFFDRVLSRDVESPQSWYVEAYNSDGLSWSETFWYRPYESRWQQAQDFARRGNSGAKSLALGCSPGGECVLIVPATSRS